MSDKKGAYRLKHAVRCVAGITSFGLDAGKLVNVRQEDAERHKVLIDFGGNFVDWYHESWLNNCERIEAGAEDRA